MNEKVMENQEEIKIEDIVNMFKKRWKMIVSITVSITLLAAIIGFFITMSNNSIKYQSITRIFIQKDDTEEKYYNSDDMARYQKLLGTCAQIIMTNDLVEKAIDNNNLDVKSEDVLLMLNAAQKPNTQILEIKYTSEDKVLTKEVLDAITNEFLKVSKEIIPNGNVKVIQTAREPEAPINTTTSAKVYIAIGFSFGLMVSVGLTFLLEIMNKTFSKKEQLEQMLGIYVIGVIPNDLD